MRTLQELFGRTKLSATAASILVLAAFVAGCDGSVTVDAGAGSSGHEPAAPPAGPCEALPWSRAFGRASDLAMSTPWVEPQIVVDGACSLVVARTPSGDLDFGGGAFAAGGLFVARLGPTGDEVWTRHFDGGFEALGGSADGHLVVGGTFDGAIDFRGGIKATADGPATFLVAVDAAGAPLWSRTLEPQVYTSKVLIEPSGAVLVTGNAYGTVDFGSGPQSSGAGGGVRRQVRCRRDSSLQPRVPGREDRGRGGRRAG